MTTEPINPATDKYIAELEDRHALSTSQVMLIKRIQSDAARIEALELERDTIQEYADRIGANLTAAEGTIAERDEQIARYEDLIAAYSETDAKAQKAEEIGGGYETRATAIEFLKAEKAVAEEGRAIIARRKEADRG